MQTVTKADPLLRSTGMFALVFLLLQWGYQASSDTPIERAVIDVATVRPSAFLINRLSPEERVRARGHRLISEHVKLSVLNGCEGTESVFLVIAAIVAFRAGWRHKLWGIAAGIVVVYLANQARIVALYFALRHDRAWFSAMHGYILPTLIIAIGCWYFLWWIQWSTRAQKPTVT